MMLKWFNHLQILVISLVGFSVKLASTSKVPNLYTGCGKQAHTAVQGIIQSPGYPDAYPNGADCVWMIKGGHGSIISISFISFDIEDDDVCNVSLRNRPCCSSTWLKLGVPDTEEPLILCGGSNSMPKPYLSSGPEVYVKFHSASSKGLRRHRAQGFKLSYLIIPFEVTMLCRPNETTCSPTLYECHPKCDHVMNCLNGADEMGCVKGCQGRVMCSSWSGCYLPDERCNGVAQCGDHSDEKNCGSEMCRSERGGFLCSNLRCIRESWQCDQTNDCGDNSDEINCLKNSVITAAVMGSLICGLLLVIAIGCTCKLYALRYRETQSSGGPRATLPMSPLEQELFRREPPPPYSIAVSHAPVSYFGGQAMPPIPPPPPPAPPPSASLDPLCYARMCRGLHHHRRSRRIRRQRRQQQQQQQPIPSSSSSCLLVVPSEALGITPPSCGSSGISDHVTSTGFPESLLYIPPSRGVSLEPQGHKASDGSEMQHMTSGFVTTNDNHVMSSVTQIDADDCPLLDEEIG